MIYNSDKGVATIIAIILIVAITLVLVGFTAFSVFSIGGDTSELSQTAVQVEQNNGEVIVTVLENNNFESILVESPSNNQDEILDPQVGSSISVENGEGKYRVIGLSNGEKQVIRTTNIDLNLETTSTTGTLSINPNIPNAEIISKDENGRIIDTNYTDSDGNFNIETVEDGFVIANVENFDNHSTISSINNNLYTSKQVTVNSIKSNNGIEFTAKESDVFTVSNSEGDKVDILYENVDGVTHIGNVWQLEASNNVKDRNLKLVSDIKADKDSFVSFIGSPVSNHPKIERSGNSISGLSKISELSVTWLDVGQADSILINAKGGDKMVIDTGDRFDDAKATIHYINKKNIEEIDHLVASHQDSDHIGGHADLINTLGDSRLGNIYDNGVTRSTQTAEDYIDAVSNQGLTITEIEQGDKIPFDGAKVEVLNPEDSGGLDKKGNMVVLKLTHGNNTMFFGGDVESESESRIVDAHSGNLDVNVMDIPHHGSSTSSTEKLLDELNPDIGVVSAPYNSPFGHPKDEVINRYENRNIDLYWTAANGNVTIISDGSVIQTKPERGEVNDVTKDSDYNITIKNIPNSVEQGTTANVDYKITNKGNVPDIQDIKLDVNGNTIDQRFDVKINESETYSGTLSWSTDDSQSIEDYNVKISSEDDSVKDVVSVIESTLSNTLKNPSFESGSNSDADNWIEVDTSNSGRTDVFSREGSYSISMKDLTSSYSGRELVSNPVSVTEGKSYQFGAYYYLPSNESEFTDVSASDYRYKIELVWINSSGEVLSDSQITADVTEFDSWNKVTVSGTSDSKSDGDSGDATEARIQISAKEDINDNGNIYWDSAFIND